MRKPFLIAAIMMAIAMVASNGVVFAGITNIPPYADDFESYTNGTPLIDGTNGWYGDFPEIIVQANSAYSSGGTNSALIPMDCRLFNRFESSETTNIMIQMDLRPVLYSGENYPEVNTNRAAMFYINSNGNFVVHNGPASPSPAASTNWLELTAWSLPTNGTNWVQINIYEDFSKGKWTLVADGNRIASDIGFVNPSLTNFTGFDVYNGSLTSYLDNVSVAAVKTNHMPLIIQPSSLNAVAFVGNTPPAQVFNVYNIWPDATMFAVETNCHWMSPSPSSAIISGGSTTEVTLIYAQTESWASGTVSNGTVSVIGTDGTDRWSTQTVAVSMSIMEMQVTPTNMADEILAGSTPTNRQFDIINAGAGTFTYTATITNDWLSFSGLDATNGTVSAFSTNTLTFTYANTAGWMAGGTSNTTVTIVSEDGGGALQTIDVSITPSMNLFVAPTQLSNVVMHGETTVTNFQVWTTNAGIAVYAVTANQPWIALSQSGGSLTGHTAWATNTITVTYTNTASLVPGNNYGMITIGAPGCPGVSIGVTLTVRPLPMLNVGPALITNTVMAGQNLAAQVLSIWNSSADYGISYQIQVPTNTSWLSLPVTNNYLAPLATNSLTINYTVGSLVSSGDSPSNYFSTITVMATNANGTPANGSPVVIPVKMQVNPKPRIGFSPTNLSQTVLQGRDAGSQGFYVWNASGFYTLESSVSKGVTPWLVLTPTNVTSTGQYAWVEVQYSTANLPAGQTNATITLIGSALDGVHPKFAVETQTIVVALSVTPFATLATDAQSEYAYTVRKGTTPSPAIMNVWNGSSLPGAMYFTVTPSVGWFSVNPSSASSTGDLVQVQVQADPAGMNPGVVYRGTVQIDAIDEDSGKPAYGSPYVFSISIVCRNFKGFDFQGGLSGASDLVLYREANGAWEIRNLMSDYGTTQYLGGAGYQSVPGDYTGDGISEMGVYRPASGSWYAQHVGDSSAQVIEMQQWSGAEYVGVQGDYDGDGKTDPAVYLEESGLWMVLMSASGYQQASGFFGGPGFAALASGDYDGDNLVDPGVYHRESGLWYVLFSTSHSVVSGTFGGTGYVPVPTDYDGDGMTDPAVYGTESGYWYILPSTTLTSQGYGLSIYHFGGAAMSTTLVPAPGNYDGVDGADLGLYDTAKWCWYIMRLDGVPLAWGYPMGRLGCLPVLP